MSSPRVIGQLIFAALLFAFARGEETTFNLPVKKINLCGKKYSAWVADTFETQTKGLMNFRRLRPDEAMIFIFDTEEPHNFWMKNCPYDLDVAFFDAKKHLVSFTTMKGTSPLTRESALPGYPSGGPIQFAVEVAPGSLKKLRDGCKLAF